jgi:hypothetical protein
MRHQQTKLRGLSLRANYTYRPTAACRQSYCQLLGIVCHVDNVTDLYGRILVFLDQRRYFFFQVAPQLYSRGWVDPVPDPLLLRKPGSAGNRTRTSGSVARNSDYWTTEAVMRHQCFNKTKTLFDTCGFIVVNHFLDTLTLVRDVNLTRHRHIHWEQTVRRWEINHDNTLVHVS